MALILAHELVDAIVNHLSGDNLSLKNCSLVSHAFTSPSQRRLFYRFTLLVDDHEALVERMKQQLQWLLSSSPIRCGYIQIFQLCVLKCNQSLPFLIDILDHLNSVRDLTLRYHDDDCQMDERLAYHCCKPTITRFAIHWVPLFPSHYLRRCISLQELVIEHSVLFVPQDSDNRANPLSLDLISQPPVLIDSFTLERNSHAFERTIPNWVQTPECPIDFRKLTSLSLRPCFVAEIEWLISIIPILSGALESISIDPPVPMEFGLVREPATIDLSLFPHLTYFSFSVYEDGEAHNIYSRWLISELSTISINNGIKSLHIIIQVNHEGPPEAPALGMEERWKLLDEKLSEEKFNVMENVHVDLDANHVVVGDWKRWIEWVRSMMCKTIEQKRFSISGRE